MSLEGCLLNAVNAGKISRERADELIERARGFAEERIDAEIQSLNTAFTESALKRKQAALQTLAKVQAVSDQAAHPRGQSTGLNSILARDVMNEAAHENVDQMGQSINMNYLREMADPINRMRTKAFGLTQDTAIARDLVRAVKGEAISDAAVQGFAKSVKDVLEDIRVKFNEAGGHILKRENYFPQTHEQARLARAAEILKADGLDDRDAWVEFVLPKVWNATDDLGVRLTDDQMRIELGEAYDAIATDGLTQVDALKHTGTMLANRHRDARFLNFNTAEDWIEYNNLFGNPNILATLTDYVSNMSHEIALLKRMGPNPTDTYNTLKALADVDIAEQGLSQTRSGYTDALWNVVSGKANTVHNLKMAEFSQGLRNATTSFRLGSAMLSAVSDLAFVQQTANWNGLGATRIWKNYLKLLNPLNATDRLEAARATGIIENWTTRALAANRFSEITGSGWTAVMADATMRLSGLSHHTNVGQQAVGMEVLATLAEQVGKNLEDVPEGFPLARFLSPDEWDVLRSTPLQETKFGRQVHLDNLMARTDVDDKMKAAVSRKLLAMIKDLSNKAVPMPDARSRAITTAGAARGTLGGEATRFAAQFKGFPISVIMQHLYAGLAQSTRNGKAAYMAQLVLMTTTMGALALQLKEISKGRDPLPTNTAKFWTRAFTQGGGAGIYGDFVQAGLFGANRFGQNLLVSLMGPTAGTINDVIGLSVGQFGDVIEGKENKIGSDVAGVVDRYTPVLSSLWYTRLAFERLVVDELLRSNIDPDAREKNRRKIRRAKRENDQEYWWRPGTTRPQRAPEIL